jgi:hypothetical protein
MDHDGFEALTRAAASEGATRRRVLRLLTGGMLGGVAARLGLAEDAAARHKRKRKKKGARCMTLRQSCTNARCCGSLGCGDNGCDGGNVCFQHQGGSCTEDCDCGGDLKCSERFGDTCRDRGYPETPCEFTSECCLKDSICGDNGCDATFNTYCCQWEPGSLCSGDCDCCAELECVGNLCVPFLGADGAARRRRATDRAAEAPPTKGRWPRREPAASARQAK